MREALINGHQLNLPDWRADFYDARTKQGWERERIESCADLIKPGMTVYDIGAEHGDFTALYKKWVGVEGTVIPVEPSWHYWPIIREIWEMNDLTPGPAYSFAGFASDQTDLKFGSPVEGWHPYSEGAGIPEGGFRHLAQQREIYPQIRLDELASLTLEPDAIIMDIEGAEWHALAGMQNLLKSKKPLCWISVHPSTLDEWYHKTPEDIHSLMSSCGYTEQYLGQESELFYLYTPKDKKWLSYA